MASGVLFADGVRMTRRSRNSAGSAAAAPVVSLPATGCAATSDRLPVISGSSSRTTYCFTLPTSVTTASGAECSIIFSSVARIVSIGTASTIRSAPRAASTGSRVAISIMPRSTATSRFACERPSPTTLPTTPARFAINASEPPIKPTPHTVICRNSCAIGVARLRAYRLCEHRDQPTILFGQADADSNMARISVTVHRAHDHALAEQLVVNRAPVADIDQEKICVTRDERHLEARELALEVVHPLGIDLQGPVDMRAIVHPRYRSDLR